MTTVVTAPRVLGIDPSLTCTGLAGDGWTDTIKTSPKTGDIHTRYDLILTTITDRYLNGVDLVVIEGLSFDSHDTSRKLAGLGWLLRHDLYRRGVPYADVPPSTLKQFIAGKGNAAKADVTREVTRRFPWFEGGEDEADAVALCAAGYERLGAPITVVPALNRGALAKVRWPEMVGAQ